MRSRGASWTVLALCAGGLVALSEPLTAFAQSGAQGSQPAPKAAAPKNPPKSQPAAPSGDGGVTRRIEQLEEQLVDMQVVIGTLESLARGGGQGGAQGGGRASSGGGGMSPAEAGRLDGLETQIRALTAQIERLAEQVRAMEGGRPAAGGGQQGTGPRPGQAQPGGFGSVVVAPGAKDQDPIGSVIKGQGPQGGAPLPQPGGHAATAQFTNPKQLFEVAYAHMLQQEYGPAEAAFSDFLQRFPNDNLAGSAQYWLGETHFVRGQYQAAARAFLKGYQNYRASSKAPDSLLKLAMSLEMLGQRNEACASFAELSSRFPQAPAHVRNRASAERQRLACT